MRIALVHYTCGPVVGGVERVVAGHARLFERHGHAVTLICQRGGEGENVLRIPGGGTAPGWLREVCAGQDVVVVHNVMTMPFDPALTLALAALPERLPGVRFLAWTHDLALCNADLAPVPAEIARCFAGFEYIAVSALRRRQLHEALGIGARVVPDGFDPGEVLGLPDAVARMAEEAALFDGRLVLLHPARILRRKNIECGIRVVAAMNAAGHRATLIVTGAEDSHNPASRQYAAELAVLRAAPGAGAAVLFAAERFPVGASEIAGLYRVADALFFPSRSEGFGLPVIEAAVHGLPVFCSDIEPLRSLAARGATFFPPDAPPGEIAKSISDFAAADERILARKEAMRASAWETVYTEHLAPLLAGTSNPAAKP